MRVPAVLLQALRDQEDYPVQSTRSRFNYNQ
jgi:hypothetical protein